MIDHEESGESLRTGFRGSHALALRRDSVATLGAIYIEWTRIESFLSIMLATLMFGQSFSTGNEIIIIEMMDNCSTINGKIACINAAARKRLYKRPALLKKFLEQLKGLETSAKTRNMLVHGRWTLGDDPDKIVHRRRTTDEKTTSYNPKTLLGILRDLERKSDRLYSQFFDQVVPASEKILSAHVRYFASVKDS